MTSLRDYREVELTRELAARRQADQKRQFDRNNWPHHFAMDKLKNELYMGVARLPNLKEIDAYEFAAHPCISGSYSSQLLGSATVEYMPGIKFARYAKVFMQTVDHFAGYGVAFVAVPENPDDWNKSQNGIVPLKLRHWSFCICEHKFGYGKNVGHCSTDYECEECGWTYNVDSSG